MALSDPLVPDNTFDPIPRGRAVDIRTGALTPGWRNWHESKGRQLGEIISGVDRNSENIVQLETDYTAADGVVTSAYISADAVVASDAESARATLSTTLTAAYQAADVVIENSANTYTDAEISTEQTVRAAADAAEASARTSLQATLESADATLQSNIDSEASTRATADSTAATDRTTIRSEFAAADTAVASAANTYTDAEITTEAATRAAADTAEATARETLEATLISGGAASQPYGLYDLSVFTASRTGDADSVADLTGWTQLTSDARLGRAIQATGDGSAAGNVLYQKSLAPFDPSAIWSVSAVGRAASFGTGSEITWGVLVEFLNSSFSAITSRAFYAFDDITSLFVVQNGELELKASDLSLAAGSPTTLAYIRFGLAANRSEDGTIILSQMRVRDTARTATVEVLKTAFVDSNGNAYAGIRLVAAASGSDPAIIELTSGDGGAAVRLGGDTEIDGDLVVNGTITADAIGSNEVTQPYSDESSSVTMAADNTYDDLVSFSATIASGEAGVLLQASANMYHYYLPGSGATQVTDVTVQLLRDSTVLAESVFNMSPLYDSGNFGRQPVAFTYFDTTVGTQTYKMRAKMNGNTSGVQTTKADYASITGLRLKR